MENEKELLNKITSEVKGELALYASKKDLETAVNAAVEKIKEEFKSVEGVQKSIDDLKKAAVAQGEVLEKMKSGVQEQPKTIKQQLESQKDNIKKLLSGDYTAKTTVLPTAITSNFNGQVIAGIGKLDGRQVVLRSTFNQGSLASNNQLIIRYMDQTAVTSNAAARTVGNAAGEMAITWQGYSLAVEQYSHMIPVALEMLEDFDFIENEIKTELVTGLDRKIEYDLVNGNGSTPTIYGIVGGSKYTAFSAPTGLANNVKSPNIMDVIMAAATQCQTDSPYNPNIVWMNNAEAMALKLTKDDNGMYVFPNFISANGMLIDGIRIVPSSLITANTLYVGDFNYRTLFSKGVTVTIGLNSDDFSKRKVTILANEPVSMLSKAIHAKAVIGVTSITDAITALYKGA